MPEEITLTTRGLEHILGWADLVSKKYLYTKSDSNLAMKVKNLLNEERHKNYLKQKQKLCKN